MTSDLYQKNVSNPSKLAVVIILFISPMFVAAEALQPFTSDGCTLFPEGTAEERNLWCECCLEHDLAYWRGGTAEQKNLADLRFKSCIAEKSGNMKLAETMYLAVKLGGQPYFPTWYRWGYGWSYGRNYKELTEEELRLVSIEMEHYRKTAATAACAAPLLDDIDSTDRITSDLAQDETVVFFTSFAIPPKGNGRWTIPIHGWVYEPEESVVRKNTFAILLKQKYGLTTTPETQHNFDQRTNLFLADNERRKNMVIRIGEQNYIMTPSEPNGHFHTELKLQASTVQALTSKGMLRFELVLSNTDPRSFRGTILIPDKKGISVISDIDDTVKVTQVFDSKRMWENTFFNDFVAVPGMADLYRRWVNQGAMLHFVSSSPWQLYTPISDFLKQQGFPAASFSMKYVRFKDETFFNLFKSGNDTKPGQIEPILKALPGHRFILVGDSGEQDPQVYANIARKYPDQIIKIYIRDVVQETNRDYSGLFLDIPTNKWRLFTSAKGLQSSLDNISGIN